MKACGYFRSYTSNTHGSAFVEAWLVGQCGIMRLVLSHLRSHKFARVLHKDFFFYQFVKILMYDKHKTTTL